MFTKMLLERIHFFCEFARPHAERLRPVVIKNENALFGQGACIDAVLRGCL
jgi:hypothetical protein